MRRFICFCLAILFLLIPLTAFCEELKPDGYINDYANVLDAQTENNLNLLAKKLDNATSAQIAVVMPLTLDDEPIDDFSYKLFKRWGIGNEKLDNGVLIVIAPNETKSHIEVGKGLEGQLNDAKTGFIQDNYIIPALKSGDYNKGVNDVFNAVFNEVAKEYNLSQEEIAQGTQAPKATNNKKIDLKTILIIIGIIIAIILDFMFFGGNLTQILLFMFLRGGRGGGNSGGGGFGGFGGGSSGGGGSSRDW